MKTYLLTKVTSRDESTFDMAGLVYFFKDNLEKETFEEITHDKETLEEVVQACLETDFGLNFILTII